MQGYQAVFSAQSTINFARSIQVDASEQLRVGTIQHISGTKQIHSAKGYMLHVLLNVNHNMQMNAKYFFFAKQNHLVLCDFPIFVHVAPVEYK